MALPRSATVRFVASFALVGAAACASTGGSGAPLRTAARGVVVLGGTDRYPVAGSSVVEIGRALRQASQRADGGFIGHYTSQFRWSYRYVTSATSTACRLADFRIDVASNIRIPDWRRPPEASDSLAALWETFFNALMEHERQHERIALESAAELSRLFERMTGMSCNELGREANREGERLMEQMRERQRRFDIDSQHGTLTGARWPPRPTPAS